MKSSRYWFERAKTVREDRNKQASDYLNDESFRILHSQEEKNRILKLGLCELRFMILNEEIKIKDLLRIFYERALTVGIELNALADINIAASYELADKLESQLLATPREERDQKLGLLFGVPISVKDNIRIKGMLSTMGCSYLTFHREEQHGLLGAAIEQHGGIPFIKTNVPMFLKTFETVNHIYGRCLNPWNRDRTSGGSSGGESAVVSSYCSPAGIGGDIGGSIRTPCHYTGIWGLKPTPVRITLCGYKIDSKTKLRMPNISIMPAAGPMARCVEDLVALFKVITDESIYRQDRLACQLPWDETAYGSRRRLRVGKLG